MRAILLPVAVVCVGTATLVFGLRLAGRSDARNAFERLAEVYRGNNALFSRMAESIGRGERRDAERLMDELNPRFVEWDSVGRPFVVVDSIGRVQTVALVGFLYAPQLRVLDGGEVEGAYAGFDVRPLGGGWYAAVRYRA